MQDDIRDRYRTAPEAHTPLPHKARRPAAPDGEPATSPKKPKKGSKKWLFSLLVLLIIIGLAFGIWWFIKGRDSGPIPKSIQKSAGFAIYYPSSMPLGYSLDKSSVNQSNQIIFFKLKSGDNAINISEQAAPPTPPDFSALQKFNSSFKNLSIVGGRSIYGISQNQPVALLLTNTTLININGTKGTPLSTVAEVTENMNPITN